MTQSRLKSKGFLALRLDTEESDERDEADWQNEPALGRSLALSSSAFSSASVTSRSSALCFGSK